MRSIAYDRRRAVAFFLDLDSPLQYYDGVLQYFFFFLILILIGIL